MADDEATGGKQEEEEKQGFLRILPGDLTLSNPFDLQVYVEHAKDLDDCRPDWEQRWSSAYFAVAWIKNGIVRATRAALGPEPRWGEMFWFPVDDPMRDAVKGKEYLFIEVLRRDPVDLTKPGPSKLFAHTTVGQVRRLLPRRAEEMDKTHILHLKLLTPPTFDQPATGFLQRKSAGDLLIRLRLKPMQGTVDDDGGDG